MSGQPGRRVIAIPSCVTGWLPPISAESFAVSADEGKTRVGADSSMRHKWFDLSGYHRGSPDWNLRSSPSREEKPSLSFSLSCRYDLEFSLFVHVASLRCRRYRVVIVHFTQLGILFSSTEIIFDYTLSLSLFGYGNHVRSAYANSCMIGFRKDHAQAFVEVNFRRGLECCLGHYCSSYTACTSSGAIIERVISVDSFTVRLLYSWRCAIAHSIELFESRKVVNSCNHDCFIAVFLERPLFMYISETWYS